MKTKMKKPSARQRSAEEYFLTLEHMNHERAQFGHPPVSSVPEGLADNLRRMEENEAKWVKDFEHREAIKTQE